MYCQCILPITALKYKGLWPRINRLFLSVSQPDTDRRTEIYLAASKWSTKLVKIKSLKTNIIGQIKGNEVIHFIAIIYCITNYLKTVACNNHFIIYHDFAGQDFGQSSAELVLQLHVALTEITQNSACEWPLLGEGRSKMVSQTSNVLAGMAGRQHLAGVINQTPYMWPLNEMVSGESDFSYGGAGLHKQDFQETRQKL